MDYQPKSTKAIPVENQLTLIPQRKSCPPPDLAYVMALPNARRSLRYSISLADLEPKQVYDPLEMDKAIWSKIEGGVMSFPLDKLLQFQAITQNDAPLLWLNSAAGYDIRQMVRVKSSLELENEKLRQRVAELEKEREIEKRYAREVFGK